MAQQEQRSRVLILAKDKDKAHLLEQILCRYFPSPEQGCLHISNKYYSATVNLAHQKWPGHEQLEHFDLEEQPDPAHKQELLVMLVGPEESHPAQLYDFAIHKHNPQGFILVVDLGKDKEWKESDVIKNEVNNFIEVVQEDLKELSLNPPQRKEIALLKDNYEDGSIWSLLQLVETTPWTHLDRKPDTKQSNQPKTEVAMQKVQEQTQAKIESSHKEEEQQDISEEQMEQQMAQFEGIMRQMMSLKQSDSSMPNQQRKQQAQNLLMQLLGAGSPSPF